MLLGVNMAKYQPNLGDTVELSTGKLLHPAFDHPNHNGFEPVDHKLAADWHARQARGHTSRLDHHAANFHFAQKKLHEMAAEGRGTKIRFAPSIESLSHLPPHRKAFWQRHAANVAEDNKVLEGLEPYRMSNVIAPEKITKSRTIDNQEVKRVEMDRNPPQPRIVAEETENSVPPEYRELLNTMMANRRAQRHGDVTGADLDGDTQFPQHARERHPPQSQLAPETQDMIRDVVARRQGQRFNPT
jgi:hypothetical protein